MQRNWWIFVHIGASFVFLMAHGTSVAVFFRLRKERDRERIRTYLQLSGTTARTMYLSLAVLVGTGLRLAFMPFTEFHKFKWPWISLGLLVAVLLAMLAVARPYYRRVSEATLLRPSGAPRASDEELDQMLRSPRPALVSHLALAALVGILYMMVFKKPV